MKLQFNTNDVPKDDHQQADTGLIPVGKYPAKIESVDLKDTKAGTGSYLNIMFRIEGDKQANRCAWAVFNINNPNEKAQEIGKRQLAQVCEAVGIIELEDTDQLLGKQLEIDIRFQAGSNGYPDKHQPKYFNPLPGAGASVASFSSDDSDGVPF